MQRAYSMFPIGVAGLGLMSLRAGVLVSLWSYRQVPVPWLADDLWSWGLLTVSASLWLGLFTPIAAMLCIGLACVGLIAPDTTPSTSAASTMLAALALLLLGPGAYSVDARLYGYRILVLPRSRK